MTKETGEPYVIPSMMYGYYDYSPFHMFGSIFMILFWVVLIAILFRFLLRGISGYGPRDRWSNGPRSGSYPIDILKERYAKGELTKEQFEQMKKDIE
jgi:putative membrane protein